MQRPALIAFALATTLLAPAPALAQVVDMDRFDGRWFEIARNPNRFQRSCTRLTIDWTAQEEAGRWGVMNTCTRSRDGRIETLPVNARSQNASNSQFRMSLTGLLSVGGLASQTYQVWDRAPDYSWAIIGLRDKTHYWIWTRQERPSAALRNQLIARAAALGFDTSEVVHTGR